MNSTSRIIDEDDICYEDNHFIAVLKKSGDIVQGDSSGDETLTDAVKAFLKHKYNKPGNVFAAPCHRLDRPVQGIVLFAKTSKGASRMAPLFSANKIRKCYLAILEGKPSEEHGFIDSYLQKDSRVNQVKSFKKESKNSKLASTEFELISTISELTLAKLFPKTGRSHQLRVHMSQELGNPICGDIKYGAKEKTKDRSLYLFAESMEFEHPIKKERVLIKAKPPTSGHWKIFFNTIQ